MTNVEIAKIILSQLGGNRLSVMTGARNFVAVEKGLQFRIPKAKSNINSVRVTLTPADDYTVEFFAIRGTNFKQVAAVPGVYCDQLQDVFTEHTGLYTSL
jgi:hypothetical protein